MTSSVTTGRVSQRAADLLAHSHMEEYIVANRERAGDAFDAKSNPDGYICMAVAENKLLWDLLEPKFADCRELEPRFTGYDHMIGALSFRERLASFLGRVVFHEDVDPGRLAVVNGSGSAIELLFWALCDPGDGVLVPTPSYMGFWLDIETRDDVKIVPVHTHSTDGFELTTELLDRALATADRPVKALLYTNPVNPLGRVDPPEKVDEILTWGERHGIHVVIDEVYALSIFDGSDFVSGARLRPEMSDWLHVVWAFSKDFGVSGLRTGLIYTHNEKLHAAVDLLAYWAAVSGDTQSLLEQVISDDDWVDAFVAENARRLGEAYRRTTGVFDRHEIPFVPGGAGFFFLLDVRSFLEEPSFAAEYALWRDILETTNVNLTPGSACRNAEPGFLRVVFTGMPLDAVVAGAERVATHLVGLR